VKAVGLFVGVFDIDSDEQSAFTDVELPELHQSLFKHFLK
jgi:putative methionine-R-sulfoxide reductase with GAF domain